MAQVWQRLADDYADAPMSLFPMEGKRPAMQQQQQQQQQIQPDDHKNSRGRDGRVREELAAKISRSLINAQIAAPLRLSKK